MRRNLALFAASLVVCLILAEAALRIRGFGQPLIHDYDPDLLWRLPPHEEAYAPSYGVAYSSNAQGWRDDEIAFAQAPGELRILALGDSVLFGQGVAIEQIFSEKLESHLAAATGRERVEVINTGISGYSLPQYRTVLELAAPLYRPDLVLVLFVKNDMVSAGDVEELRENARSGRQNNVDSPRIRARRTSALFHALDGVLIRLFPATRPPRALLHDRSGIRPEQWQHSLGELEAMLHLLAADRTPLVIATLPLERELRSGRIEVDLEPLERLSRERGVPIVSLWPAFSARAGEPLFLDAVHPSALGHDVAARAVSDFLVGSGLLANE